MNKFKPYKISKDLEFKYVTEAETHSCSNTEDMRKRSSSGSTSSTVIEPFGIKFIPKANNNQRLASTENKALSEKALSEKDEEGENMLVNNKKNQIERDNREIKADFEMIDKIINTYEEVYLKHANTSQELSNIKSEENKNLLTKIDNNKKSKYTNQRKVVYSIRELEWRETYRYLLLYVFYALLLLYLVFSNFFSKRLYSDRKLLIIFIIISLSPILSIYIIVFIYYLIDKIKFIFSNKLPKNAYVSL